MGRNTLLRMIPMVLALWLSFVSPGFSASLYEQSLEQFAVRVKQADPADYTFVVLGDSRGNDRVFRKSLALAASFKPLFILHGGDISDNGSRAELERFLTIVREQITEIPLFVVTGNHERDKRLFEETIGPLNFTIDSSRLDAEVIAVDNSDSA